MEDILYVSTAPVFLQDIIRIAEEFSFSCDKNLRLATDKSGVFDLRVIPAKDAYWDFADYRTSPDFQCLDAHDLAIVKQFAPGTVLIVTHPYNTRPTLAKFLKKLIERKGGGVITDGDFDHIDDLSNLEAYLERQCERNSGSFPKSQ